MRLLRRLMNIEAKSNLIVTGTIFSITCGAR